MNVAFVIGCARYDDDEINSLRFSQNDASAFASLLAGACGLNADEIVVLSSESERKRTPTRNNIIRELTGIRARKGTRLPRIVNLFFFFSGHGFHSESRNADFLIPQDGVASSLEDSCLRLDSVVGYLAGWAAEHTILFLDVCRAAVSGGKGADELKPLEGRPLDVCGTATFWSCSPGQKSFEAQQAQEGVFTCAVSKALSSEGKCKTVYELDRFLVKTVPQLSKQFGLPIQNPFSRVEPLSLQDTILISERTFNDWQEFGPLGQEVRSNEVPIRPELVTTGEPICGIDFGTSYSAITTADKDGKPISVPSPEGRMLVPSVVSILPNLDYLVGWKAIDYGSIHPDSTFYNVKRSLGSSQLFNAAGRTFTPEYLVSLIIRSLKTSAEQFLGRRVSEVMASAPANFTIRQWNSVLKACQMAGLTVKRLVGEPSAAALIVVGTHLPGRDSYDSFFVLDLGGGTFDVSVIEAGEGVWEIKAAGGDRNLGGVDYDEALSRYIRSIAQSKLTKLGHELTEIDQVQIRREAERAKISLTTKEETSVILPNLEVPGKGIANLEITISRSMFRALTEDLNFRLERCILDVLRRSWVRKKDINSVWSTGQGAKIFTVSEIISRLFPGIPLVTEFQENAVALGLGRYTGVLTGVTKDVLLLDATATAIGLKCARHRDRDKDSDSPIEFWIAPDQTQNTQTHILLPRDMTIPTFSSTEGRILADRNAPVVLEFMEVDLNGEEIALGAVPITPTALDLQINFDVDANRTIILRISSNGEALEALQLNNFSDTLRFSIESFWDIRGKRPMKLLAAQN